MPKHKPTITISGATVQCDWDDPGAPVVLDGVRVRWGRDRLYDPTQPSEAILDFLDPDGAWGSNPALFGSDITITTDLGTMFRGKIDGITLTPDTAAEANPSIPPDVWRVQLTASDVIADLARITPPGSVDPAGATGAEAVAQSYYGPGRWTYTPTNSEMRRAAITTAMRKLGINTKVNTKDFAIAVPPGHDWTFYYREPQLSAGDDLYTLIQAVQARGDEITHARYLPDDDLLTWGGFPTRGELILTYAASVINAVADAASGARTIPCGMIGIDGSESVDSAVTHNISSFRVNQYTQGTYIAGTGTPGEGYGAEIFRPTAVEVPVGGARGFAQLVSAAMIVNDSRYPTTPTQYQNETAAAFAARVIPVIAELNGRLLPPDLVFDIEAYNYGTEPESVLMCTYSNAGAWTFPGARYEALTGWGPFFQLIGGELAYQQGWTHTATFAPSLSSTNPTLNISQLVTTDPPLLNQYADTVSLSTLGVVTERNLTMATPPATWENATPVFGIRYPKPNAPAKYLPDMFQHTGLDVEQALLADNAVPPGLNYRTGTRAERLAASPVKDQIWVETDTGGAQYIGTGNGLADPQRRRRRRAREDRRTHRHGRDRSHPRRGVHDRIPTLPGRVPVRLPGRRRDRARRATAASRRVDRHDHLRQFADLLVVRFRLSSDLRGRFRVDPHRPARHRMLRRLRPDRRGRLSPERDRHRPGHRTGQRRSRKRTLPMERALRATRQLRRNPPLPLARQHRNGDIRRLRVPMSYRRPTATVEVSASWRDHLNRDPPSSEPGTDYPCPYGSEVVAVDDGVVTYVKTTNSTATGRVVEYRLDDGRTTRSLHLADVHAWVGMNVHRGDLLALSGASGFGSDWGYGPHVHQTLWPGPAWEAPTIDFELYVGEPPPPPPTPPAEDEEDIMAHAVIYTRDSSDQDRRGAIIDIETGFVSRFGWFDVNGYANDDRESAFGNPQAAGLTSGQFDAVLRDLDALTSIPAPEKAAQQSNPLVTPAWVAGFFLGLIGLVEVIRFVVDLLV